MDKKKNLNLLIRGEAFRIGGNMSRSTNGNIQEQKTAVLSIIKYIIQPLHKFYNLNIYIDVVCSCPKKKFLLFKWFYNIKNIKKFHIYDRTAYGQLNSIRRSINKINNRNFALFMIRIDCVFKTLIPFNRLNINYFYVPALGCDGPPGTVNEIFIFIPRFKLDFFIKSLNSLIGNCHQLYNILRKLNFDKNKLKFILKYRYGSGTNIKWNPIFYLTARKIAPKNKNDKDLVYDF